MAEAGKRAVVVAATPSRPTTEALTDTRNVGINSQRAVPAAFLRLRWRQINFAEKGEKGKEEGEGRGRKEEGRKEGV